MPSINLALFRKAGSVHLAGQATPMLPALIDAIADLPGEHAGLRIYNAPQIASLITSSDAIGASAAKVIGPDARAVRAILFDKTVQTNWSLGWHQDRTICVASRVETAGYGPWTIKHGQHHVAPPIALLESMVTLRVHLDDVDEDNAPLLIAPGSHKLGSIPVDQIGRIVKECGVSACLAAAGDIWLYATPILHASAAASNAHHRRVLQIDYAATDLPNGLEWAGV